MRNLFTIIMVTSFMFLILFWVLGQDTNIKENKPIQQKQASVPQSPITEPSFKKPPSIMEVPPTDIYNTYLNQYRLRPDNRFIKAMQMLVSISGRYQDEPDSLNPFHLEENQSSDQQIVFTLFKKKELIDTIRLPLPISFPEQMAAMQDLLNSLKINITQAASQTSLDEKLSNDLIAVTVEFYRVDPRSSIKGLMQLEKLRQTYGNDARLYLTAARGYTMLLLGLVPDYMQHNDQIASQALAFLAFAKQIAPELETSRDEAILAMNMGYTAYANHLINQLSAPEAPVEKLLDAYIRKDIKKLEQLRSKKSTFLNDFLLLRLYRETGLKELAQMKSYSLFENNHNNFPFMVETIYSADLNTAKKLTAFYPSEIIDNISQKNPIKLIEDVKKWISRFQAFSGLKKKDITLTEFEGLLKKHYPSDSSDNGFFINIRDIKNIFRIIYSDAVYFRFNLLLNRWSVVKKAEDYIAPFREADPNNPLIMQMTAEVLKEIGQLKEADQLLIRLTNHPNVSSQLSLMAHSLLESYSLNRNRVMSTVASRLDGRPENLSRMGKLCYRHLHYDFAEKFYTLNLKQDPFSFYSYYFLALINGNDTPVKSGLKKFPNNLKMLQAAGNYYAFQNDIISTELAHNYFEKAVSMAPFNSSLVNSLADVLEKAKRYEKAIQVLKNWIENYGSADLPTTIKWGRIAYFYLKLDQPLKAMDILIDNADTYGIVWYYLKNNKRPEAIRLLKKQIKTYQVSYQYLKKDLPDKAIELLTHELKTENYLPVRKLIDRDLPPNHLDNLIINCIKTSEYDWALKILDRTKNRYEKARAMLESKDDELDIKALKLISKNVDDYQGGVIIQTARVYEALNQFKSAEKTFEKGLKRHFTSGHQYSSAAAYMWRNNRYEEAADFIVKGSKNKGKYSRWYFEDFMETFRDQDDESIIKATETLIAKGVTPWQIFALGFRFFHNGRPQTAYKMIANQPTRRTMETFEKIANLYIILESTKGKKEAYEYISQTIKGDARSIFSMVLFSEGLYSLAFNLIGDPDSYSRHREFVWLQKLMSWLAVDKIPKEYGNHFRNHYQKVSPDYYHAIGKFMLSQLSRNDLLKQVKTSKQRCEFAYYIGFSERMQNNFSKAANWYQICLETLLENNGEYHWAYDELFWWAHMGLKNRHRLLSDDKKMYYKRKSQKLKN